MRREAVKLRLDRADCKYSVSDGAPWIHRQYSRQLPMLDAMILDYYHFRDHAIAFSKNLYGEGTMEARQWRKSFCRTMLQSGPLEALTELVVLTKTHRGHKRQSLQSLHGYIARRTEMPDNSTRNWYPPTVCKCWRNKFVALGGCSGNPYKHRKTNRWNSANKIS